MTNETVLALRILICAVTYGIVWYWGDREARQMTAIGAIPSWLIAAVLLVAVVSGTVYAEGFDEATWDDCEIYWFWWFPYCWPYGG